MRCGTQPTAGEGGARERCAGPRHNSGVKTRSRGITWRVGLQLEAASAFSPAAFSRQTTNNCCDDEFAIMMGLAVGRSACIDEQQSFSSQGFLSLELCSCCGSPSS